MTAALILVGILLAANAVIWFALLLRWLGIRPVRVTRHPGKHVSTERIHAGGRYLGTQPRSDAVPLTEQQIEVTPTDDAAPWDITTGANPVLNTDAETLFLYRQGEHGTKPHLAIERSLTDTGELRAAADHIIARIKAEGDAYRQEMNA